MGKVVEETTINAGPETVWALAGDPGRIADWVPALKTSQLEGDTRRCALEAGGELEERILEHSADDRFYVYEITDGPMPLRSYRARFAVEGHDGHTHVVWTAEFEPEEAEQDGELEQTFSEVHRQGLETLRERAERPQAA